MDGQDRIYVDHAATTATDPRVIEAMLPYLTQYWGNSSSIYFEAREARKGLDVARRSVAEVLGARPNEVLFTSGGTEGDNLALRGVAYGARKRGNHIITTTVEHHAVLHTAERLEGEGFRVTYVPVDKEGFVDMEQLKAALDDETTLVSVMYANNEIGAINNIAEVVAVVKEHDPHIAVHTDAVQAAGYLDLNVDALGVDLLSLKLHMDVGRFPTNRIGLDMQPGPETDDVALSQLLGGDLDAVIMTTGPRYYSLFGGDGIDDVVAAHPGLRTLVTEPDVIVDAYRRTGLYPISDVVVLRRELVDEAPEAPAQLVDAFSRANALAGRHRDADEQRMADRELALLDRDPYGYELGPDQRLNLKAYTDFFYRMGAIERPLEPEELFVPSTLP